MPEIDLRTNPWAAAGAPRHGFAVSRELYSLLTIFGASETIAARSKDASPTTVYGYVLREYEFVEVGRILTNLSAMLRNEWNADEGGMCARIASLDGIDTTVGTLTRDLARPEGTEPLLLRESFNKILHCATLNPDRSERPSIYSGHLNPFIHLYGEHREKEWKATLDVYRWAENIYAVCDW
jgi:hypothetical protein